MVAILLGSGFYGHFRAVTAMPAQLGGLLLAGRPVIPHLLNQEFCIMPMMR